MGPVDLVHPHIWSRARSPQRPSSSPDRSPAIISIRQNQGGDDDKSDFITFGKKEEAKKKKKKKKEKKDKKDKGKDDGDE